MRPVDPVADEPVEEQPGDARPGKAVGVRVVEVGDVGLEPFAIAFGQRQAPASSSCALPAASSASAVSSRRVISAGQVGPERDARGAGQRGEIDDQLGLLLARARQRVAEDQPPFGIGVADLDA